MNREMKRGIERGVIVVFCLVFMSSFVLGAAITNVQITPVTSPNTNYAIVNVNVAISETYLYQINNLIFNYKLPGSSPGSYSINPILIPDSRQVSFSYPNPQNGITFDYQIQGFNNVGTEPYIYYPSSGWNTYSNINIPASTSTSNTNNISQTVINTTPQNTQTTPVINSTNNTQTSLITGNAVSNNSSNSSSGIINFVKTLPGTIITIFLALVLLIILVRVSRGNKNKTQNTAEVIVSKPE